jgi:hypothetical protein
MNPSILKNYQIELGDLTQKGLLKAVYKYYIAKDRENELVNDWDLANFFENFWGITPSNYPEQEFPHIEDWLEIIDWAVMRGERLFNYDETNLLMRKECVISLIMDLLKILETPIFPHTLHSELVSKLFKEKLLSTTAFFSFNYDLIIDICLRRIKIPINYGIQFDKYPKVNPANSVLLLKLHGSLDWVCCPKGHLFFKDNLVDLPPRSSCPSCNPREFSPLQIPIIPPTFLKKELMEDSFINKLYDIAFKCFKSAERIYLCGYSIPEADMDFKYLIKRVESETGAFPDIYLCNSEMNEGELNRIKSVFRNKEIIHNTNLKFEEFVKMPHDDFLKDFPSMI